MRAVSQSASFNEANANDRPALRPVRGWVASRLPGVAAASTIAIAATLLGRIVPVVGAPVFAIVIGIALSALWRPGYLQLGVIFASRKVLQGAIVFLGFGLSFHELVATNERALPVLLGTLFAGLGAARLAGRLLRVPPDVTTLVGVGTAICGASAIAATDAVIDADQADVSYAVATIFTFNVFAVLTFPALGHAFGLSQHAFGLWAGTAINDVSSVVAASTVYGHAATSFAVVVKLTRTLAIIPITIVLGAWRDRTARVTATATRPDGLARPSGGGQRRPRARAFPLFIFWFVAAVLVNTLGLIPGNWHAALQTIAAWLITMALAAVGLSTELSHVRRAGARPLALGAIVWATVGLMSLALQTATGTL